jgi:hypothetical protein
MIRPVPRCRGPISRRSFLQAGALGCFGLGLADLLRLRAMAKEAGKPEPDTSVILLWLPGGPPHMETFDMKPDAPSDYRGEFGILRSNVPGMDVCELLPRHAKIADKYAIVRSIAHDFADHGGGHKRFLTARDPLSPVGFVNDYPAVGSMVAKMREGRSAGVPNYVSGTDDGRNDVDVFSFGAAYLGPAYTPFTVAGDPSSPRFEVKNLSLAPGLTGRLDDRVRLLDGFDRLRRAIDQSGAMEAMDEFNRRALELLTSNKARTAFDLSLEAAETRDRYGRHPWGQRCLMARRLVEAGTSFVTMVLENPVPPGQPFPPGVIYNWDSHAVNGHIFDDARVRLPIFDQAVTALIEDLYRRGLDKKVLLIVTGEFGRTPRISYANGRPGRDHWPQAMSVVVSGGGLRTGQVIGSTNSKGEHPKDRPLTPNDLWATAFRHLGIDTSHSFPDHRGRPMPILPYGEPIRELI